MDSSPCPLSKHSSPLGERTNHQFIRSVRSDWETTVLKGRDLCHLGLICLLDVRAKISQVKVHGLHNIMLWMLNASYLWHSKKARFSVDIKLLLMREDQTIWNAPHSNKHFNLHRQFRTMDLIRSRLSCSAVERHAYFISKFLHRRWDAKVRRRQSEHSLSY